MTMPYTVDLNVNLATLCSTFQDGKVSDTMSGSSTVLVVLGTLILWFGW